MNTTGVSPHLSLFLPEPQDLSEVKFLLKRNQLEFTIATDLNDFRHHSKSADLILTDTKQLINLETQVTVGGDCIILALCKSKISPSSFSNVIYLDYPVSEEVFISQIRIAYRILQNEGRNQSRMRALATEIEKQEAKKALQRLTFLADANVKLTSSLDVESVLSELTKLCVPTISDWCVAQIRQSDGKLKETAISHRDPEKVQLAWDAYQRYPPDEKMKIGATRVIQCGQSVLVKNISRSLLNKTARDSAHLRILKKLKLKSYLCVPIKLRDECIGALTLVTSSMDSARKLSEADLRWAEDLAARAGIAIENARLFRQAQNLNRVKDEFLATLSHELRTPLNIIQGNADLLLNGHTKMKKQDVADCLLAIDRNARLQTQIVSDLLDVSSIVTGKITLVPKMISPSEIASSVLSTINLTAEAKGVKITYDDSSAPKKITADASRLHQILWNVLNNAVKFTPTGGNIHFQIEYKNSNCVFTISDNGIGISREFLPFVFERFIQANSSNSRPFGGLGLGLSIVKHLVEVHAGIIQVQSNGKDQGTTFKITLPIQSKYSYSAPVARNHVDEIHPKTDREPIKLPGIKVLLVEDSEDNRTLIDLYLRKTGIKVLQASSAMEARQLLSVDKPDLIISDIGMPEENGLEFIRTLRKNTSSQIPAIALTAYVRPQEIQEALEAGFQVHIAKPVSKQILINGIARALGRTFH